MITWLQTAFTAARLRALLRAGAGFALGLAAIVDKEQLVGLPKLGSVHATALLTLVGGTLIGLATRGPGHQIAPELAPAAVPPPKGPPPAA